MTERGTTIGTVVRWDEAEGWGALRSDDVPGEVWAHFSAIAMTGFRIVVPGDPVQFTWEATQQDGYASAPSWSTRPASASATPPSPRHRPARVRAAERLALLLPSDTIATLAGRPTPAPRTEATCTRPPSRSNATDGRSTRVLGGRTACASVDSRPARLTTAVRGALRLGSRELGANLLLLYDRDGRVTLARTGAWLAADNADLLDTDYPQPGGHLYFVAEIEPVPDQPPWLGEVDLDALRPPAVATHAPTVVTWFDLLVNAAGQRDP